MHLWISMKTIRLLTLFILSPILFSCQSYVGDIFPERPTHKMDDSLVNATPEFIEGWRDGCEVGMSAGSNTFYKIFYRNNRVDGYKMTGSPDYKTAWSNSFWYCYRHDYIKQKSPIYKSMFTGVM